MSGLRAMFYIWLIVLSGAWSSTAQANLWSAHPQAAGSKSDSPAAPSSGKPAPSEHPRVFAFTAVDVWDGNAGRTPLQAPPLIPPPTFARPGYETIGDLHHLRFESGEWVCDPAGGPWRGYLVCRYSHAPPERR